MKFLTCFMIPFWCVLYRNYKWRQGNWFLEIDLGEQECHLSRFTFDRQSRHLYLRASSISTLHPVTLVGNNVVLADAIRPRAQSMQCSVGGLQIPCLVERVGVELEWSEIQSFTDEDEGSPYCSIVPRVMNPFSSSACRFHFCTWSPISLFNIYVSSIFMSKNYSNVA